MQLKILQKDIELIYEINMHVFFFNPHREVLNVQINAMTIT